MKGSTRTRITRGFLDFYIFSPIPLLLDRRALSLSLSLCKKREMYKKKLRPPLGEFPNLHHYYKFIVTVMLLL